jgi:hypothetical protein
MKMDIDEANKQPAAPVRGKDPLFHIKLELDDSNPITKDMIEDIEIDDFKPPPHGESETQDFDLLAHLEVEQEAEGDDEEDDDDVEDEEDGEAKPKGDASLFAK